MPYELSLIDANGTIFADRPIMYSSSCRLIKHFAPNAPMPSIDDFRTGCATMGHAKWHYHCGVPRSVTPEEMDTIWTKHYDAQSDGMQLTKGARSFLLSMRQCGIPVVIVSAAPKETKRYVEALGINYLIDRMIFGAVDKTAAIIGLLRQKEYRKIVPGNVFFIGDTVNDIIHGNEAKVATFAYTEGHHDPKALRAARPKHMVSSFKEALNIVRAQIPEYA